MLKKVNQSTELKSVSRNRLPIIAHEACRSVYPSKKDIDLISDAGFTAILEYPNRKMHEDKIPDDFDPNNPDGSYNISNYWHIDYLLGKVEESNANRPDSEKLGVIIHARQLYQYISDTTSDWYATWRKRISISFQGAINPITGKYYLKPVYKLTDYGQKEIAAFLRRYNSNPTIVMWDLADEPKYDQFALVKVYSDAIRDWYKTTYGPAHKDNKILYKPLYVNLEILSENILESFIDTVHPDLLSYDYYPIEKRGCITSVNEAGLYDSLAEYSAAAKNGYIDEEGNKVELPLWKYSLSIGYFSASRNVECPNATEGSLRLEVFSALAYGAQAILYFRYSQATNTERTTYFSALVDSNGNPTPQWYYVKKINEEIKEYEHIFLGCKVLNVYHSTNDDNFFQKVTSAVKLPDDTAFIKNLTCYGDGVLVSLISQNGEFYAVIVNHSPFSSQTIDISLAEHYGVEFVSPHYIDPTFHKCDNNSASKDSDELLLAGKLLRQTLLPGGYMILRYKA